MDDLFRRILVAVDDRGLALNAAVRAFDLAEKLGSDLHVVHALPVPAAYWDEVDDEELAKRYAPALAERRTAVLTEVGDALRAAGMDDTTSAERLSVLPGAPSKIILREARRLGVGLIVLGPHEKLHLLDFGSTTRTVLAHAGVPVWTQRENAEPIRRILVSVDFSEHSRHALAVARALAKRLDASLAALHCYSPPVLVYPVELGAARNAADIDAERNSSREELERWASEHGCSESIFVEGGVADQILERQDKADLFVLGTHGRTALSRFLLGSVAQEVTKRAKVPVLVVTSPKGTWQIEHV